MNRTLPERIFICGFMGAGKSTAGQHLAKVLEKPFQDLDDYIEAMSGKSISDIFNDDGESEFRRLEKSALLDIIRKRKGVIALGGGTLHNQHLLDHIKVNGLLVFIKTSLSTILDRIKDQHHRPLLMNENGALKSEDSLRSDFQTLYDERVPFYEQAEITIHSEEYDSPDELAAQLAKKIRYHVALH